MVGIISRSRLLLLLRRSARGAESFNRRREPGFHGRSAVKCRTSLSSAPFQPCSWLARDASVCRRECVKVSSVPVSIASQIDFDTRLFAGFLGIAPVGPTPAHDQTGWLDDFDILAAALMLGAVKHPEPDPEPAAHANIGFGKKHRSVVGAPPAGDAVRCRQGIEDDRGAGRDPAHQGQARHGVFSWVFARSGLCLLGFGIGGEPVEACRPEALISAQPVHRLGHRFWREAHRDGAALSSSG